MTVKVQTVPLVHGYGVAIELPKLQMCTVHSTSATMLARSLTKALFGVQALAGCSYSKGTGKYPALDTGKVEAIKGMSVLVYKITMCTHVSSCRCLNRCPYFAAYVRGKYPNSKDTELNLAIGDTCVQARRGTCKK